MKIVNKPIAVIQTKNGLELLSQSSKATKPFLTNNEMYSGTVFEDSFQKIEQLKMRTTNPERNLLWTINPSYSISGTNPMLYFAKIQNLGLISNAFPSRFGARDAMVPIIHLPNDWYVDDTSDSDTIWYINQSTRVMGTIEFSQSQMGDAPAYEGRAYLVAIVISGGSVNFLIMEGGSTWRRKMYSIQCDQCESKLDYYGWMMPWYVNAIDITSADDARERARIVTQRLNECGGIYSDKDGPTDNSASLILCALPVTEPPKITINVDGQWNISGIESNTIYNIITNAVRDKYTAR